MYLFSLAGCRPYQLSDVNDTNVFDWGKLIVQNITITCDTEYLNLLIINDSHDSFSIGTVFQMEQKEKSEWVVLSYKTDAKFILSSRYVLQESTSVFEADLRLLEKSLKPGEYRIVIPADGIDGKFYLVAHFAVT